MKRELKGSCGRRCCWSPFVSCIRGGNCACHRTYKSPFQLLVEEATRLKESDEK